MRTRTLLPVVGLALAALVGCSTGGAPAAPASSPGSPAPSSGSTGLPPPTPGESGVEGRTMVGARCPVEIEQSPCATRPIAARLTAARADTGVVVATTTSGPDGWFRLPLVAGRYLLQAVNLAGTPYPRSSPVTVVVGPGHYTGLTVAFESGLQ